jgi:hypothetical protein
MASPTGEAFGVEGWEGGGAGAVGGGVTVVWTSLGPLLRWVPGPTTWWAPGTTRLVLHDTCWREAQGLPRDSTRLGSYTCRDPCKVLLAVHD